jgi:hypothetical protein
MTRYAVVIRHREADWEDKSAERRADILRRYLAWMDDLETRGIAVGSEPLRDGGRVIEVVDVEVVDGPFTETKEVVGGFVLIEAPEWEAATAIARARTALWAGDRVEVREVSQHDDCGYRGKRGVCDEGAPHNAGPVLGGCCFHNGNLRRARYGRNYPPGNTFHT